MVKKKKFKKTKSVKPIRVKYDHKIPPSDEEATRNFKVGFWRRRHKPGNKKGIDNHPSYVYARKGQ